MDKQLQPRFSRQAIIAAATSVVCIVAGGLLWFVPGMNRLQFVADLGVRSADTMTIVFYVVGGVLVVGGGIGAVWATKRLIGDSKQYKLPPKDEKDPAQIEKHLKMVADWHPDTAYLVQQALDQMTAIRRSMKSINDFFVANPGAFIDGDTFFEYGTYKPSLQKVIDEMSRNLIGLVYTGYATQASSSSEVKRDLKRVINTHQDRVDAAQNLATTTALTINSSTSNSTGTSAQLRRLTELAEYATHWGNES